MDIVGVDSINAEFELLSALVFFFQKVGVTSKEVGLKVNSRKLLNEMTRSAGVPDKQFAKTCIIVDKLDKIGADEVRKDLKENIGLDDVVADRILKATTATSLDEFEKMTG